jgi:hypothetical protein
MTDSRKTTKSNPTERALGAAELQRKVRNYRRVGKHLGISGERARQLALKGKAIAKVDAWWGPELPWHLGMLLAGAGYRSKAAVARDLVAGKIYFTPKRARQTSIHRVGAKGLHEICAWAGVDAQVVVVDPDAPGAFAKAMASGLPCGEAVAAHITGGSRQREKMALRTLQAVAALSPTDVQRLLEWATDPQQVKRTAVRAE